MFIEVLALENVNANCKRVIRLLRVWAALMDEQTRDMTNIGSHEYRVTIIEQVNTKGLGYKNSWYINWKKTCGRVQGNCDQVTKSLRSQNAWRVNHEKCGIFHERREQAISSSNRILKRGPRLPTFSDVVGRDTIGAMSEGPRGISKTTSCHGKWNREPSSSRPHSKTQAVSDRSTRELPGFKMSLWEWSSNNFSSQFWKD